jgi:hypothetical protein
MPHRKHPHALHSQPLHCRWAYDAAGSPRHCVIGSGTAPPPHATATSPSPSVKRDFKL